MSLTESQNEYGIVHVYNVASAVIRGFLRQNRDTYSPELVLEIESIIKKPLKSEVLQRWLFTSETEDLSCFHQFRNLLKENLDKEIERKRPLETIDHQIEMEKIYLRGTQQYKPRHMYYDKPVEVGDTTINYSIRAENGIDDTHLASHNRMNRLLIQRAKAVEEIERLNQTEPLQMITREMNKGLVDAVSRKFQAATGTSVDSHGAPLLSGSVVLVSDKVGQSRIGLYYHNFGTDVRFVPREKDNPVSLDDASRIDLLSEKSEHVNHPFFENPETMRDPHRRAAILKDLEHVQAIAKEQVSLIQEKEAQQTEEVETPVSTMAEPPPTNKRRRGGKARRLAGANPFSLERRVKNGARFV